MFARYGLTVLLPWLLCASAAGAMTVAVFPVEDLSEGQNGVNFALTEYLSERLEAMGLDTLSQEAVVSFMARHRVRWLGFLDTYHVFRARDELGADFILLGTVSQRTQSPTAALGLALYLIRTDDGRTVWSDANGLSVADVRRLLGVAEPRSTQDLLPSLAENVLASWPKTLDAAVGQPPLYEIEGVTLRPTHVGPGKEVECTVRLRSVQAADSPQVFLKVGGRGHLVMDSPGNRHYETSWRAPEKDGRYPVSLVLRWPSGRQRVAFVGTYYVDSRPPTVALDLKGVRLAGTVAFRDQVLIIPHMLQPEPVSRWQVSIENEKGVTLLTEEGSGTLPPRFAWKGQTFGGQRVGRGFYDFVLKVWDRAENEATSSERVAVVRTPPAMTLEAKRRGSEMVVDIQHQGEVPIAFWRIEMRADNGELLKMAEGETLPAQVDVAMPEPQESRKVECVVVLKDILGNLAKREIKDLVMMAMQGGGDEELSAKETWPTGF